MQYKGINRIEGAVRTPYGSNQDDLEQVVVHADKAPLTYVGSTEYAWTPTSQHIPWVLVDTTTLTNMVSARMDTPMDRVHMHIVGDN